MRMTGLAGGRLVRKRRTLITSGWLALALAVPLAVGSAAGAATPPSGILATVAGGTGGPGLATGVAAAPCGLTAAHGSVYAGDGLEVQQIATATGQLTTAAGNGADYGPGGSLATQDSLGGACGTAVDHAGNLVIADSSRVQVLAAATGTFYGQQMTAGHLYTVAGGGTPAAVPVMGVSGVAVDAAGDIVITQPGQPGAPGPGEPYPPVGSIVQVLAAKTGVDFGRHLTAGTVTLVAGSLYGTPEPLRLGGVAAGAWLGTMLAEVQMDGHGNLVLPDGGEDDGVVAIAPSLLIVAGSTGRFFGQHMIAGHLYRVAGTSRTGDTGDRGLAVRASLAQASGVALDRAGNLVIGDGGRLRVIARRSGVFYGRKMAALHIYGIAGTGTPGNSGNRGLATRARVDATAVTVDGAGTVLFTSGQRLRATPTATGSFYGQHMTAGHIYTAAGNGWADSGDGEPALNGVFGGANSVASDAAGDMVFGASRFWVVMATTGSHFGRTMTAGDAYAIGGDAAGGYSGDGGPAIRAGFSPEGIDDLSFDQHGNVLVADSNNERVRVIAASTGVFYGQHMTAGDVYTIAGDGKCGFAGDGGPAIKAKLCYPVSANTDQHGNVLIGDGINRRVRVLADSTGVFYGLQMTAGDIYTIAGDGNYHYSGDGGPATSAGLDVADAITDPAGNVLIADEINNRVRVVAASTGVFYGQQMTAGDIYTIAGNGTYGNSGTGGPATSAQLAGPIAIATDSAGDIMVNVYAQVWTVAEHNGDLYGQQMSTGDAYLVAEDNGSDPGTDGIGDGGPALDGTLMPRGIAVAPGGALLIADSTGNRIRSVSP